jgi:hypothetical protein
MEPCPPDSSKPKKFGVPSLSLSITNILYIYYKIEKKKEEKLMLARV